MNTTPCRPAAQSYVTFMNENLFSACGYRSRQMYISPMAPWYARRSSRFCLDYEKKITALGGLDLQILGIGRTGHIGFNEPGSAPNSGTRLVTLDDLTRNDASRDFGGKQNVPTKAITMGVGTIFKAREIILMAWSPEKSPDRKKSGRRREISGDVPATFLQLSDHVEFVLDEAAASSLTRFDTPWLVKDCHLGKRA